MGKKMNMLLLIWIKYFKFILISFLLVNNSLASLKIGNSASKKIISTKIEVWYFEIVFIKMTSNHLYA